MISDDENEVQTAHVRHKKKRSKSDEVSVIDIKKKKKKRKSQGDKLNDSYLEHIEENNNIEDKKEWDDKSTKRLFKRIQKQNLNTESTYRNVIKKLNWDKVIFNNYSAEDCRQQWKNILKKLRTERSISEVIEEGRSFLEEKPYIFHVPVITKLKKPLSPYFLYMSDCRKDVLKKHPHLSIMEQSSVFSKMFNELSEKKKEYYHNLYVKNVQMHKKDVLEHSKKYPKLYIGKEFEPKIKSSMQLYLDTKCEAHIKIYPNVSRKDIINEYKKRWSGLSDDKKLKYIKKVQIAYIDYSHEADIYIENHKDFKKKITFLTAAEQDIWERYSGKPILEYRNAFQVYKAKNSSASSEVVTKEWKTMKNIDKNIYVTIANKGIEAYEQHYNEYIDKLPDDCRQAERDKMIKISQIKLLKENKTKHNTTNSSDVKSPKLKKESEKIELIDSDDDSDDE